MITASEARMKTATFKMNEYNRVCKLVEDFLPIIDESIKYHSEHGFSEARLLPYDESRFPFLDRQLASEILERTLTSNGYTVLENDYKKNVLRFKW